MPHDYFGPDVAAGYDERVADMFEAGTVQPAVGLLAELAANGPALEFGIGTGRIALPLAAQGIRVHGIDLSEAMVERLRRKPGGESIPVRIGDFATTLVDESFALVYLVFNTINNLTTQDEQVACFGNAARHLPAGGHFVVEVGIPQLRRLPLGQSIVPFSITAEHLGFDEYDLVHQSMVSHHYYRNTDGRFDQRPIPFRYVWPSELDLMARIAGMTLVERWSDWHRHPLTNDSPAHVSIWRREAS